MKIEINQAPLLRKFVQTMRLLDVYLNHFPKHERHGLCVRMRCTAYTIHDLVVEGMKRYHKKTTLTSLDIAHEQLRMQCLLAFELGYFGYSRSERDDAAVETAEHRYMAISRLVDELGRMIGAWISTARESGAW